MTYEITYVAHDKLENNLPKNRKDFTLRTKEYHSSESSSDDELELLTIKLKKFLKQESKNKNKLRKNATTCYERKKNEVLWDESSSSDDEEQTDEDEMTNFALTTFDDEVNKIPLVYFKIT